VVRLGEHGHEHPRLGHDHGQASIWLSAQTTEVVKLLVAELQALSVKLSISDLVNGMINWVFIDQDQASETGVRFIGVNWHIHPMVKLATLLKDLVALLHVGQFGTDHHVQRHLREWDLRAWQDVHHIELHGLSCLLSDWQDLEPTHALDLLDHIGKMIPVGRGQGGGGVNSEALKLSLLLIVLKHLLFLVCAHSRWLWWSLNSFPE
jgi:hypothetical protein